MSLEIKVRFDDVASMVAFINYNLDSLVTTDHEASGTLQSIQTNTSSEMSAVLADLHPTVMVDDLDD